ncbi:vWA domain-containing protein [Sanguibacter antarcticus]|uniref:Ca-activated chloride channel family protein n=1 Tax=Sanguibacter antarcticus TaxID=372484 RepID=A0A2A9E7G3_9MICO|nr:VWA domain-containing protein [Sanguibacter antarcticus]PFG34997.1 Ca-activated chloride channel family protein [Sanguibacter antarcticus]
MVILAAGEVTSSIRWPWLVAVVLVVVAAAALVAWYTARHPRSARSEEAVWVANSEYLQQIPELRAWVRRYRALQWLGVTGLLVATVGTAVIAARPADVSVVNQKLGTRDIVLCLDVSGSMLEYDKEMVEVFSGLVESFEGERIALSIFNSTSRTVFPLTDDYTLVQDQLVEATAALDPVVTYTDDAEALDRYMLFTAGTTGTTDGSSLIGDGLASCVLQFDEAETERSRSIILATDNDLMGAPIYSLQESVDLAASRGISLNGLYGASDWGGSENLEREYREAIEGAGGMYFYSDDAEAVETMVRDVQAQQAVDLDASPEVTSADKAGPWFLWAVLGVTLLVVVQWRLRE